jgi:hypothetical protein
MRTGTASLGSAGRTRRTWPAVFTALTLACVTPPAPADASQPPSGATRTPPAQGATPPAAPAPTPAPAPATPPTATPASPAAATSTTTPTPASPPATAPAPSTPAPVPAAAAKADAESPCDTDWVDGRALIIALGHRKDDGKPLTPFRPDDPMYPYELPGSRFLFTSTEERSVIKAVGRFDDRKEAEAALKQVEVERPSTRAFITVLGPYLVPASPTCRVTRLARGTNPTIDASSWIVEKEGVLVAGSQTPCTNGKLTKKVTVMSCDGMKNLMTDTSVHVCDHTRHVDTCVYAMEPGVVLLKHAYTLNGVTTVRARAFDVRKKKQVYKQEFTHGSGLPGDDTPNQPETDIQDVDGDGVPELVVDVPDTGQRTSVRKWSKGKFVETRSP